MKRSWILVLTIIGVPFITLAHPTSFKGSYIVENKFSDSMTEMGLGYSVSNRSAVWGKVMGFPMQTEDTLGLIQINHLLQRWNAPESQGNLYVGLGGGQFFQSETAPKDNVGLAFIQADWETRHIYLMADHHNFTEKAPHRQITKARVGFAPFLTDYQNQSAWMIFEGVKYDKEAIDMRALLRLYYRNILWEVGGSMKGYALINLMSHF